jgi:hypothetical protein
MTIKDGTYQTGYFRDGSFGLKTEIGMGQGYWVSDDSGVIIQGEPDSKAIADAFSLMDIEPGEIVGVWTDEGITYIDRSYHFIRKDVAIDFGNLYSQKAIWDCKAKEEIRL